MQPTATPKGDESDRTDGSQEEEGRGVGQQGEGSRGAGATDADRKIDLRRAG